MTFLIEVTQYIPIYKITTFLFLNRQLNTLDQFILLFLVVVQKIPFDLLIQQKFSPLIQLYNHMDGLSQPMMCNLKEEEEQEQTISLKNLDQCAIFPKFIQELNAQQNNKHRLDTRPQEKKACSLVKQLQCAQDQYINLNEQLGQQVMNKLKMLSRKRQQGIGLKQNTPQITINGNRIICNLQNNVLHGQAQIYYSNGYVFKGIYRHGIRIKGTFKFNNGYQYTGGFFANKFKGYGQLKIPTGKVFCGNWNQNQIQGNAEIRYISGEVYQGSLRSFQKHGQGYFFLNDGRKYIGQFQQGHMSGYGQLYQSQTLLVKGLWKDGQLMVQDKSSKSNQSYSLKMYLEKKEFMIKKNCKNKNDQENKINLDSKLKNLTQKKKITFIN